MLTKTRFTGPRPGTEEALKLLERAWQVRRTFFPDRIEFVDPSATMAISVTGANCALKCAHCNGVYLKHMSTLSQALGPGYEAKKSYLVSGGCDKYGKVPLMDHLSALKKLKEKGPLNLHTGLVDEEEAKALGALAEVVSFDFLGDEETIAAVYGFKPDVGQYLKTYRALLKVTRVVPHICIGLNRGEIKGEEKILELLRFEAVEALSFIVLRPTKGTAFSACKPPAPEEAALLIAKARLMFPATPLYLGCMRPGGRYREKLDVLAIKAGVNKIVLPTPAASLEAKRLKLNIIHTKGCCSL